MAQNFEKRMNRKLLIGIVSCIMAMGGQAETVRVMRFVPVTGEESEVALESLQKVVFTHDSVVLISATDGEATPMYKYDYQAIVFGESTSPAGLQLTGDRLQERGEKFIKDGQLFIRLDERVYNAFGVMIE
jgi:hypothetical protein